MEVRLKTPHRDAWQYIPGQLSGMPSWLAGITQDRTGSDSLFIQGDASEETAEIKPFDWVVGGDRQSLCIEILRPVDFAERFEPV